MTQRIQSIDLENDDQILSEPPQVEPVFIPLSIDKMPTSRLQDVMRSLERPAVTVINIDAILPMKNQLNILKTFLLHMNSRKILTLSIKYNILDSDSKNALIDWIESNDTLEFLYILGCGLDVPPYGERLQTAWKKHLLLHRYENNFNTYQRVKTQIIPADDDE